MSFINCNTGTNADVSQWRHRWRFKMLRVHQWDRSSWVLIVRWRSPAPTSCSYSTIIGWQVQCTCCNRQIWICMFVGGCYLYSATVYFSVDLLFLRSILASSRLDIHVVNTPTKPQVPISLSAICLFSTSSDRRINFCILALSRGASCIG